MVPVTANGWGKDSLEARVSLQIFSSGSFAKELDETAVETDDHVPRGPERSDSMYASGSRMSFSQMSSKVCRFSKWLASIRS